MGHQHELHSNRIQGGMGELCYKTWNGRFVPCFWWCIVEAVVGRKTGSTSLMPAWQVQTCLRDIKNDELWLVKRRSQWMGSEEWLDDMTARVVDKWTSQGLSSFGGRLSVLLPVESEWWQDKSSGQPSFQWLSSCAGRTNPHVKSPPSDWVRVEAGQRPPCDWVRVVVGQAKDDL